MSEIEKGANKVTNFHHQAFFYESARQGFEDFLKNAPLADTRDVLLPAFVGWSSREGSGVYDPVSNLDLQATFYPLNRDLTVDLDRSR